MILCCGEALIDMLPRETAAGEPAFAPLAGGAVFNTAIALGRLGAPVGWFGGLSTDLFGDVLARAMTDSNVDHTHANRSDRPTTLAFVTLTDGHARYAFYDENTAGRMLTAEDLPELGEEITTLFLGGISLAAEPCADAFAAMAENAGDRIVMVDPNIRPGFIRDEATFRDRLDRILAGADIVKVSDEDMDWLGTTPQDLVAGGCTVVLVTRGAEGVEIVTPKGDGHADAHPVTVVDTVGAGDTFNGGFLAGLTHEGILTRGALRMARMEVLESAAGLGTRAAAVTVSRAGANPPWEAEL